MQRWEVEAQYRGAGGDHPKANNRQKAKTATNDQGSTDQRAHARRQSLPGEQRAPRRGAHKSPEAFAHR